MNRLLISMASPLSACALGALVALGLLGCSPSRAVEPATRISEIQVREIHREQALMGTAFEIKVSSADEVGASQAIEEAYRVLAALEARISEWRPSSEISAVNDSAGREPVPVGVDLHRVVRRALQVSEWTDGAFDITFASCGALWSFPERRRPSASDLDACLPDVNHRDVVVTDEPRTIYLRRPGQRIGIGGIGKGYGVDLAAAVLEEHGFMNYAVDGGGDIRVRGHNGDRPWTVAIADPVSPGRSVGQIELTGGAVVTSGDYERYFEEDGVRYHHILDPRTGMPARGSLAVTVLAETATDADAFATALFVLGAEEGVALAESLDGLEALAVAPGGEVVMTSGFRARMARVEEVER